MFTYRGKIITETDIAFIREFIVCNPDISRWALSRELCRQWNWVQPNDALRGVVCRGMMLELHREGHIRLPEIKRSVRNFAGTCYKAANWIYLGDTTGRGKNDQTNRPNRSIKAVWGYPLAKDFRAVLCGGNG